MWRYTLRELYEEGQALQWQERQANYRAAWMVSMLLRAWCKNVPTPEELLGESTMSPEDAESALEAVVESDRRDAALRALEAGYASQRAKGLNRS